MIGIEIAGMPGYLMWFVFFVIFFILVKVLYTMLPD
jgi:hypothetical protein